MKRGLSLKKRVALTTNFVSKEIIRRLTTDVCNRKKLNSTRTAAVTKLPTKNSKMNSIPSRRNTKLL